MKIGIFSPFNSQNYGTVLQAFALAKVLQDKGVECAYLPWGFFKLSLWGRILFLIRHPLFLYHQKKNRENNKKDLSYDFLKEPDFQAILKKNAQFVEENTPVDPQKYYLDNLSSSLQFYDKIIVGSDQTWCPDSLYQYSPYYLPGIKGKGKKFSYACSMGTLNVNVRFQRFLKKKLKSFDLLSCREESNSDMLSSLLKRDIPCVLDPTLLLNRNDWHSYSRSVRIQEKYILCYILGEKDCIRQYANELGARKGLTVYYIMTRPSICKNDNVLKDVGVSEFLWLVENCQYLVTDSFHGTIFAINFHRNMMSFDKHEGNAYDNGRIFDVLAKLGLSDHYMTNADYVEPADIDYTRVDRVLDDMRNSSIGYINRIIEF